MTGLEHQRAGRARGAVHAKDFDSKLIEVSTLDVFLDCRFPWFKATFGHFQPPGEDHGKFAEPLLLHRCGDVLRCDVKISS